MAPKMSRKKVAMAPKTSKKKQVPTNEDAVVKCFLTFFLPPLSLEITVFNVAFLHVFTGSVEEIRA